MAEAANRLQRLLVGGTLTMSLSFVRWRVDVSVTSVQLEVDNAEFFCSTKSMEGKFQERTVLPPDGAIFGAGTGLICEV